MNEGVQTAWKTWWQLVGPALTDKETYIYPNVIVSPVPPEPSKESGSVLKSPVFQIDNVGRYNVIHYPPYDRVKSEHKLEIHVWAKNANEAEDKSRVIADDFLTSLTLAVGKGRYHAELRKLKQIDQPGEQSSWSQIITGMVYEKPALISDKEVCLSKILRHSFKTNAIAGNAYEHLLTAWKLMETSGSKPLRRSILQHFVLSVEAVVNGVSANLRSTLKADIRRNEREFADSFLATLHSRTDKPKAIREASTKLRELSGVNFIPAVDLAANELLIATQVASDAKDLYRLRSRSLSHPGSRNEADIDAWLKRPDTVDGVGKADFVARSFLVAYCSSLRS